jgi:hypothetical protein
VGWRTALYRRRRDGSAFASRQRVEKPIQGEESNMAVHEPLFANIRGSGYIYSLRSDATTAQYNQNMNNSLLRLALLLGHIMLNVVVVAWLTTYDITGSWISFLVFIAMMLLLLFFFIRHLLLFIQFLKNK